MHVAVALQVDAVLVYDGGRGGVVEARNGYRDGVAWAQLLGCGLDGGDRLCDALDPVDVLMSQRLTKLGSSSTYPFVVLSIEIGVRDLTVSNDAC